jgi:hypothetical protein
MLVLAAPEAVAAPGETVARAFRGRTTAAQEMLVAPEVQEVPAAPEIMVQLVELVDQEITGVQEVLAGLEIMVQLVELVG